MLSERHMEGALLVVLDSERAASALLRQARRYLPEAKLTSSETSSKLNR
jgi:hypothetical protein